MRKRKRVQFQARDLLGQLAAAKGWQFDPYIAFKETDDCVWFQPTHIPTGMGLPVALRSWEDADWVSEKISQLTDWGKIKSKEDFDKLPAETIAKIKKEVETIDQTLEMQYSGKV